VGPASRPGETAPDAFAGEVHLGRNVGKRSRHDALTTSADAAFREVAEACREGRQPRWLTDPLLETLIELHRAGWAHSFKVWRGDELVWGDGDRH